VRPSTRFVLILILLLALALRLYRIQAPSLWNDEGTSVALAGRQLAAITQGAANDIHPPLYYYLLHFWMGLFGNSELAVRSLSAILGTMLVLLTFALAQRITAATAPAGAGECAGCIAALCAALSPFQVYYSQEARMYMLSAFLGAAATLLLIRILTVGQLRATHLWSLAAYAVSVSLLLYTHYFAVTLVLAHNAAFVLWLLLASRTEGPPAEPRASRWQLLLRWLALQLAIAVSYAPWLYLVAGQLGAWPAVSEPLLPAQLISDVLRVFSLGMSAETRSGALVAGFGLLLLLGMAAPLGRARSRSFGVSTRARNLALHTVALSCLLIPIIVMYVLSLRRPMYNPKFLLLCTPAFHVLLAQGTLALSDWAGKVRRGHGSAVSPRHSSPAHLLAALLVLAFVTVACVQSLKAYYFDPRYARDDYRGIAEYIQAVEHSGDAVLVNAPGQIETVAYYYHGRLPVFPLPRQRPLDRDQTEADLRELLSVRRRIFAILWATDESDPERFVEGWLDQHAYKASDVWYGNVRLAVYAIPIVTASEAVRYPSPVSLGDKVRLLGYSLLTPEVAPGDIVQLSLLWQAFGTMQERYKVFTHILDARGHIVGQRDAEPGGGAKITTIWKADEQVVDNYGLSVLAGVPPGEYFLEVGMYSLASGQRLPIVESGQIHGDRILLQPLRVLPAPAPPPLSVLGMRMRLTARFGHVVLLGLDWSRLGSEHQPDAPLYPGDIVHLTLFWQSESAPADDLTLVLQLLDDRGTVRLEKRNQPTEGQYPSWEWRASEIVRDQHNFALPAELPAGRYRLRLSVHGTGEEQPMRPPLTLTTLAIQ